MLDHGDVWLHILVGAGGVLLERCVGVRDHLLEHGDDLGLGGYFFASTHPIGLFRPRLA